MRFNDIANLISQNSGGVNENGHQLPPIETLTEVFVNAKSVKRAEFYQSANIGIDMTIAFDIRAADYENQPIIEFSGRRYLIKRTYTKDGEILELNCTDLGAGNG